MFQDDKSLQYSESETLLEFFEGSAVDLSPQRPAGNLGTSGLGVQASQEVGQATTLRTGAGYCSERGACWQRRAQHSVPQEEVLAATPYSSISADSRSYYCSNGAGMHNDVEYFPSKGRQPPVFSKHDSDG